MIQLHAVYMTLTLDTKTQIGEKWKDENYANNNQIRVEMTKVVLDKIDFKSKVFTWEKKYIIY